MSWLFPNLSKNDNRNNGNNQSPILLKLYNKRKRRLMGPSKYIPPEGTRRLIAEPPQESTLKARNSLYSDLRTHLLISTPPDVKSRNHDAKRLNLFNKSGGMRKNMRVSSGLREIHHLSKKSPTALGLLLPSLPPSTASSSINYNDSAYDSHVNNNVMKSPQTPNSPLVQHQQVMQEKLSPNAKQKSSDDNNNNNTSIVEYKSPNSAISTRTSMTTFSSKHVDNQNVNSRGTKHSGSSSSISRASNKSSNSRKSSRRKKRGKFDLDESNLEQLEMALTGNTYQLLWKKYEDEVLKSPTNAENNADDNFDKEENSKVKVDEQKDERELAAVNYDNDILNQALTKGRISYPPTPDDNNLNNTDSSLSDMIINPIDAIIIKNDENNLQNKRNPLLARQQLQQITSSPARITAEYNNVTDIVPRQATPLDNNADDINNNYYHQRKNLLLFDPFTLHERFFAATLIQKNFRRYSVSLWFDQFKNDTLREERERIFNEQTHAATQIQKIYRGRAARIRFTEKLSAKFRADKYLVNFFPMLRPGSKAAEREKDNGKPLQLTPDEIRALYDRLVHLGKMAIQIQRIFRGVQGRIQAIGRAMDVARIRLELDASTFLQSYIRQWLAYRRKRNIMLWYRHEENGTKKIFKFVIATVVKIQAFYRRVIQQYKYKSTLIWVNELQRKTRGAFARMRIANLNAKALIIQCAFRIYLAKDIYDELQQTAAIEQGMERVLTNMENIVAHRYYHIRLLQSHVRALLMRISVGKKRRAFNFYFGKYNECLEIELPDKESYTKSSKFSFADKMADMTNTLSSSDDDDDDEGEGEKKKKQEDIPVPVMSKAEERTFQCMQLLHVHIVELDIEFTKLFHKKHNLVLGRMPLFCFSKALLELMENPRNPDDALELMNEGLRFDTTKRDSLIFYHIVFFTWKNDKMNQQKAMYLALVYRYLLKDVGRATKFYDLAKGIKMLPRTHPIAEHCQLFQRIQDDNIKSGDSFHNLLYVTKRRVDDIKLEIRVLRSGDNLLISGQLWDRVRKKREELAKAGKNNLRYAIRGIKEYRRIVMAKEVNEILYRLDRPRLLRPRYGEQLAKAFLPMLVMTTVKGRGQKLDIKFKQEPYPKMTILTTQRQVYLSLVVSQDDNGGLRILAVSEDGNEYKLWFQYKEIRELFLDYPVLWYHRKVPGWRDKGDKLLQMLVANLELHDRKKMVKRVVKDKYELSKWERTLYEEGNLTEEVKYIALDFINSKKRKLNAKNNFAAICIQAYFRGILGREKARLYKIYVMSTKLQQFWRNQRARYFLNLCMWYSRRYWAAVKIQRQMRRFLAIKHSGIYFGELLLLRTIKFKTILWKLQHQTSGVVARFNRNANSISNIINYVSYQIAYKQNYELAKEILAGQRDIGDDDTTSTDVEVEGKIIEKKKKKERKPEQPLLIFLKAIVHFLTTPEKKVELKNLLKPTVLLDPKAESFHYFYDIYFNRYALIHYNNPSGNINKAVCDYVLYSKRHEALNNLKQVHESLVNAREAKQWIEVDDPEDEESGLTYWWCQTTNETTHVGMPCPDDAQIEHVESMIAVITDDIRERRRAATKIQSCFRGISSRDQSAGETFKLLVKQKLFVERITIAVEAKLKHEAQEKVMAKQQKAWEKHNKKLIGNKLEPISLVKYKRLLDCKKRGVDYNSEDYSSSDEDSTEEDEDSNDEIESTSDFEPKAIEAYVFYLHLFLHNYKKARWAYENFVSQMPLGDSLQFGNLLLNFAEVEDEEEVEHRIESMESFIMETDMGELFYDIFDRQILQLSIRKHRYQAKNIAMSKSLLARGIFLQIVRKDYYEAHLCYQKATSLNPSNRSIQCVYNVFIDRGYGAISSPVLQRRKAKIQRLASKLEWRNKKWLGRLQRQKELEKKKKDERRRQRKEKRLKEQMEMETFVKGGTTMGGTKKEVGEEEEEPLV